MYYWPKWLYWVWAQAIIIMLLPTVLPVRIYEFIRGGVKWKWKQ